MCTEVSLFTTSNRVKGGKGVKKEEFTYRAEAIRGQLYKTAMLCLGGRYTVFLRFHIL